MLICGGGEKLEDSFYYKLYQILFLDAYNRGDNKLVHLMSFGFVNHFLPIIYHNHNTSKDIVVLKNQLQTLLRKVYHLKLEIKESFTVGVEVDFKLFAHFGDYQPILLSQTIGKRLKPTKLNAYAKLIEKVMGGEYLKQTLVKKGKVVGKY